MPALHGAANPWGPPGAVGSPEPAELPSPCFLLTSALAAPNSRFARNNDDVTICWADFEVCVTHAWIPSMKESSR